MTNRFFDLAFVFIFLTIADPASAATYVFQGGAFDRCLSPPTTASCISGAISGSITFSSSPYGNTSFGAADVVSYGFSVGGAAVSNGAYNPSVTPTWTIQSGTVSRWDFEVFSNTSPPYHPGSKIRTFAIGSFPISSNNTGGTLDGSGNWSSWGGGSDPGHWVGGRTLGSCSSPTAPPGGVACANPISIGTGNKYEQVTDYETVGQNKLSFIRSYNSFPVPNTYAVTMGQNWRNNYDRYLHFISSNYIDAERADGQTISFISSGGVWATDPDIYLQLSSAGSDWTLTDRNGTSETYFSSAGKGFLSSIALRNGYTQTLSYSSGVLSQVTDSYGRSLNLSYSSSTGLLTGVTTPDTLALSYGYLLYASANTYRLSTVSYNTSPVTSQGYLYENTTFPYALTGLTDENGSRFATWQYDSSGRAISSQHALGADLTQVSYDDTNGNRTVTGPLGIVETYSFSSLQAAPKVTQISRAANGTVAAATRIFTYDANGYLATATDWNGNKTAFTNNSSGDPITIVFASGSAVAQTTTIAYSSAYPSLPTTIITADSITTLTYDSAGRLLTRAVKDQASQSVPYFTSGETRNWTYTWNNTGQLLTAQLPRTDVMSKTTFGYTGGTLTSITDALSHATNILTYTSGGLPLTVTDQNSVLTTLAYNPRLWLTSSVLTLSSGGNLTMTLAYDSAGNLTSHTLPDASYLAYGYDDAHRLTTVTNPLSESQTLTYNSAGNVTQVLWKDEGGTTTRQRTATFDALGRILTDVGGMSQSTAYAYDNNSNVLSVTDPLGSVTTLTYDSANRLSTSTDPLTNLTSLTYDAHDRVLSVTDPRSKVTSYVYDGFGELIQEASPDRGTIVLRYTSNGYVSSQTDANGFVTNMTYDALDRILTRTYPADSALNVAFTYDQSGHGKGVGQLTSLTDAAGSLSLNYEERGLVTANNRTISSNAYNTAFTYQSAGRLSTLTYASSNWMAAYTYDTAGQVTTVTTKPPSSGAVNLATSVLHMPFGPVKSFTYGNGVTETRTYDLDYRTTAIKANNGGTNIYYSSFGYNANDNVTSILDNVTASRHQTLAYDSSNWLKYASGSYGSNITMTYDSSGNRKTYGATNYTVASGSNRYSSAGASALTYTSSGNITAWPSATATYNKANQLATAVVSGTTSTYTYDAFGLRLRTVPGTARARIYSYGPNGEILTESNAGVKTDYAYLDGFPIAAIQPAAATVSAIHTDYLGTPQKGTNSAKTIVWNGSYDPNGSVSVLTGTITQNLRFPGQILDASGLHYNGYRNYIPKFASGGGRYLEADPIGQMGGINLYPYANSNALRYIDPTGLDFLVVIGRPTSGNPFGHASMAVSGSGIFSFGTSTPRGSSVAQFLASQAEYRDSTLYYIPTTKEQDAAALASLRGSPEKLGSPAVDNCSTRTNNALSAAGFFDLSNPLASLLSAAGISSSAPLPLTSFPESTEAIARRAATGTIRIPMGTSSSAPLYNDPILRSFEP